ncbi:MAG: hypothetical protein ACE5GT_06330 [Rhodospirillales bacterium]
MARQHLSGNAAAGGKMTRRKVFADDGLELGRGIAVSVTNDDLVIRVHLGPATVFQLQLGVVGELLDTGEHQIAAFRPQVPFDQSDDFRQRHAAAGEGLLRFLKTAAIQAVDKFSALQFFLLALTEKRSAAGGRRARPRKFRADDSPLSIGRQQIEIKYFYVSKISSTLM